MLTPKDIESCGYEKVDGISSLYPCYKKNGFLLSVLNFWMIRIEQYPIHPNYPSVTFQCFDIEKLKQAEDILICQYKGLQGDVTYGPNTPPE